MIKRLAGRINESANKNKLEYRYLLTYEQCKFQTTVLSAFNTHLCSDQHSYLFAQNNFDLICIFCKLEENAHNFKRRLSSKRHSRNLKNHSAQK